MAWCDDIIQWLHDHPPPEPGAPVPPSPAITKVNLVFPSCPNFYSPNIIKTATGYDMWTTVADRVARYKSNDGVTWTGGTIVFPAIANTWENNDGGSWDGYPTGISDPRLIGKVTGGWNYTMYYTGGPAPNTATAGGIGCAVSQDGDWWQRVGSGILRTFPNGNAFIVQALTIAGKRHLYYLGGGNAADGQPPPLMIADDDGTGINFVNDRPVTGIPSTSIPLIYDASASSLWTAVGRDMNEPSGPGVFEIYKGGDGLTNLGILIATIDKSVTGNISNFDPQVLNRTDQGLRVGSGTDPVQIIFSTGNSWGGWQPASILIHA